MGLRSISHWMRDLKTLWGNSKINLKINLEKMFFFKRVCLRYSWFNLGGPAEIMFKPDNIEQLTDFLRSIDNCYKVICLGAGSNTLIRDGGFYGAVLN